MSPVLLLALPDDEPDDEPELVAAEALPWTSEPQPATAAIPSSPRDSTPSGRRHGPVIMTGP
jgi:hypothetical protein